MQKWERALLRMTVASQAACAWLIAADVGMLPTNARGHGVLFRWQVWLLASLVLVASRDFVSQIRCRRCGSREQISPLGLLPSRHLLCRSCLSWDPGAVAREGPVPSVDTTAFAGMPKLSTLSGSVDSIRPGKPERRKESHHERSATHRNDESA